MLAAENAPRQAGGDESSPRQHEQAENSDPTSRRKLSPNEKANLGKMLKRGDVTIDQLKDVLHPDDLATFQANLSKRATQAASGAHDEAKIIDSTTKSEDNSAG